MSTLAVNTITNATGGNTAQINGMTPTAQSLQGFRNRIINGNMVIDQRNNGASVTLTTSVLYTVDRWYGIEDTDGGATLQRSTVAPTGFSNSLLYTVTSADASLGAVQYTLIAQAVEGFNVADLGWGTANAQAITISFWVRSSLTGTFGGALNNSASNRSYPFIYTISAANTWEQKTVTIAGDTSGTWLTDNGIGIRVVFGLGAGSTLSGTAGAWAAGNFVSATGAVSVVGTNAATFYITGVQLEAGSVATPFERRDYGRELIMCQRYYAEVAVTPTSTSIFSYSALPVAMRVAPTVALKDGSLNGATYGAGPYGSQNIRQNANSTGATDANLSASAEL
jgi:hypothetical protein